jgi:hypothetical protein
MGQHEAPQRGTFGRQSTQVPEVQTSGSPQIAPQLPQLARSFCTLMHVASQQASPTAQALPQAPQLASSSSRDSHFPSPSQSPRPDLHRHLPFLPPLHLAPSQQSLFLSHFLPTFLQPAATSSPPRKVISAPMAALRKVRMVLRREVVNALVRLSNRNPSIGSPFWSSPRWTLDRRNASLRSDCTNSNSPIWLTAVYGSDTVRASGRILELGSRTTQIRATPPMTRSTATHSRLKPVPGAARRSRHRVVSRLAPAPRGCRVVPAPGLGHGESDHGGQG